MFKPVDNSMHVDGTALYGVGTPTTNNRVVVTVTS